MMLPSPADAPTAPTERLSHVDTLRGIALLGIFTVNMLFFSGPYGYYGTSPAKNGLEFGLELLIRVFMQGAFYSLFSFLFGFGFALQLRRGPAALPRFRRRLAVLLGIGLVHAVLIWYGDILVSYAAAGFVLTLFAWRKNWVLALGVVGFFALSSLSYLGFADLDFAGGSTFSSLNFSDLYSSGSYPEVVRFQAGLAGRELLDLLGFIPTVLWLFLLGMLAGRGGWLEGPQPRLWRGVLLLALPVALVFKGFVAYWLITDTYNRFSVAYSFAIGGPALMFVYLALLVRLLPRPLWARQLAFFSLTGRMALTNYLTQSLVCTLIFNGYGLGYFGELRFGTSLLLLLVIYALQILLSALWLRAFRFGPAEWLWRSLTYGHRQPLRRE